MNLYVVRHGQTDWNKKKILLGSTDIPLNETGRQQALILKEKLKQIDFDVVIASSLKRAMETAKIATDKSNIIKNDNFRERIYGNLEGTQPKNIKELWNVEKNCSTDHVEPIRTFLNRVFTEMDTLKELYNEYTNVLIVTHYGVVMAIDAYFNEKYDYCFDNFIFDNGSCKKYILK